MQRIHSEIEKVSKHDKCRNLPFGGRVTRGLTGASSIGGKCAESPPTFIWGKRRKNQKRCGLRTLSVKGAGVVFTHGEGISTPRIRHKERQPLTKCPISCFRFVLFSLFYVFMFLCFLWVFCIFIFLWSTRVFPSLLRILNCDEEIRPT